MRGAGDAASAAASSSAWISEDTLLSSRARTRAERRTLTPHPEDDESPPVRCNPSRANGKECAELAGTLREKAYRLPVDAFAFDSYDVFVDSKKLTSSSVSFAVAIHFAGFDTLYSASNPSSSRRRSARYLTYWLM